MTDVWVLGPYDIRLPHPLVVRTGRHSFFIMFIVTLCDNDFEYNLNDIIDRWNIVVCKDLIDVQVSQDSRSLIAAEWSLYTDPETYTEVYVLGLHCVLI